MRAAVPEADRDQPEGSGLSVRVRPIREPALLDELAARADAAAPRRARVIVDGPPPTQPGRLADGVATRLRTLGRPVLPVVSGDFARPASLRLESGRDDPDELLDSWLDEGALRREVLGPAGPGGTGVVLPRLWNLASDRAYRDQRVWLAPNGVLLLSGSLLLGRGLPAELTVHLRLSPAALARRLPVDQHWTLPAYRRYDAEHDPDGADVLVLADDPMRLAVRDEP